MLLSFDVTSTIENPLPKLPVPDLDDTLRRYVDTVSPIISGRRLEETIQRVSEFGSRGGVGQLLQRTLQQKAEHEDNWATRYWLDDMYLRVRLPLPVHSSPAMVFPRQQFDNEAEQLQFATKLVCSILEYKSRIDLKQLPVDQAHYAERGQPLCMKQYDQLFQSYRRPETDRDTLLHCSPTAGNTWSDVIADAAASTESVVVICRNQAFIVEIPMTSRRGCRRKSTVGDWNAVCRQLKRVVDCSRRADHATSIAGEFSRLSTSASCSVAELGLGLLTTTDRTTWAAVRSKLAEDATNRTNLTAIERSAFVLCLDMAPSVYATLNQPETAPSCQDDDVTMAHRLLHGQGSEAYSANRWFDKTLQVVVGWDGVCGLCCEHSSSESIVVIQLVEHVLQRAEKEDLAKCQPQQQQQIHQLPRRQDLLLPRMRKLQWTVTKPVQVELQKATVAINKLVDDVDLFVLRFDKFGKELIKLQNASPDAFIQLALQLTYYRMYGCLVSTYESASIRRFRCGRVDNIRACTSEALVWCRAMVDQSVSKYVQKELFHVALKRQSDQLLQTILGHGIDNHLLGLRETAAELGLDVPELFNEETFKLANHFVLSTSQGPTTTDSFWLYGPVVPEGYGVCYNPHPDRIVACISSFHSCPKTDSRSFASCLDSSLHQMINCVTECDCSSSRSSNSSCSSSSPQSTERFS